MTEATAIQPAVGEFAENLLVYPPRRLLLEGLDALKTTLRAHPELVDSIYGIVAPGLMSPMGLRVLTGMDVTVLQQWAGVLSDISTAAYRYEDSVDGEVSGLLGEVRVRIVGLIPGDAVPEGSGAHEWTLPEVTS